ncbi:MAG TPA: hypothetical protein VK525_22375 [Candidatus Saccharimonadales bacterium]|nr:hypothetical protein [Candidatus Saccharimonadales bacterium]
MDGNGVAQALRVPAIISEQSPECYALCGVPRMRTGSNDFKDASAILDKDLPIDWLNLPSAASTVSLWDILHDAEVVSIRSDLLERTVHLHCEIEHLRVFCQLDEGFQFVFRLEGVQSARVLRYATWPGECPTLEGFSFEEQRKIVAEYQAKWREESTSWTEFESRIAREDEQVLDISDAVLALSRTGQLALKICGHLNHATFHEAYLRFQTLKISGSDGKQIELEEFRRLGEKYWEAFSNRANSTK